MLCFSFDDNYFQISIYWKNVKNVKKGGGSDGQKTNITQKPFSASMTVKTNIFVTKSTYIFRAIDVTILNEEVKIFLHVYS